ncbi:hypothetical protein DFH07DRAFT_810066 [Mycena maculata]|uniref:FAD-binding domain-containing protein n=1 Tax=Mycena maculata TaxID=230809 RepID=A0AAD7JN09_9AGAR|nr:hypothetical protein DFH07DRAFT_810066 [Mycena maculata]
MSQPQQVGGDDKIKLDFAVIGGGVAGLSCAIALGRIGHRVTVIEKNDSMLNAAAGRGVRMPPNLTKILLHWGLQDQLRAISVKSEAIQILLGNTGELLGTHRWDEELLKETRGEYLFAHLSDLLGLLYDEAIRCGADIRVGTTALSIDPAEGTIALDFGGVLHADVIVGADGVAGLSRSILLQEELAEEGDIEKSADRQLMWMYSATIPKGAILNDAALKPLYDEAQTTLFCWLGHGRSVVGYPLGGTEEFAICAYGPYDADQTLADGMRETMEHTEPRLQNLLPLLSSLQRHPVMQCQPLDDWVSQSSRLVIVGTAAHPIPPGSIQESAMAVEDGAVLARLFSRLDSRDQIGQFLWAFQDIRQPRCAAATESETNIMYYTCMPAGEEQEARDQGMRAKLAAGVEVLQAGADQEETPEWQEVKEVFGYDAEDEADDWWVKWGSLRYKSTGSALGFPVVQVEKTVS